MPTPSPAFAPVLSPLEGAADSVEEVVALVEGMFELVGFEELVEPVPVLVEEALVEATLLGAELFVSLEVRLKEWLVAAGAVCPSINIWKKKIGVSEMFFNVSTGQLKVVTPCTFSKDKD
jgi:hypothetical protein